MFSSDFVIWNRPLQTYQSTTTCSNLTYYTPYLKEAAPHPSGTEVRRPFHRRGGRNTRKSDETLLLITNCRSNVLRHDNTTHAKKENEETAKTHMKGNDALHLVERNRT
jgi:hypothetical protein